MTPNVKVEESLQELKDDLPKLVAPQADLTWKQDFYISTILEMIYIHLAGIYGVYLGFTDASWYTIFFSRPSTKWDDDLVKAARIRWMRKARRTVIVDIFGGGMSSSGRNLTEIMILLNAAHYQPLLRVLSYHVFAFLGITAGCHRLWTHRCYKATLPLQILLVLSQSALLQGNIISWVQTHRQHHQYSDTDGDPHNATRGFFFSHIGWNLGTRHPDVIRRRKYIEVSDIRSDPLLMFQKRFAVPVVTFMSIIFPTLLPLLWGDSFSNSWHLNAFRLCVSYHSLFCINSVAHMWGNKPYDKSLRATQRPMVAFFALGECYHNFHHAFPRDYRTSEFGYFNFTTFFLHSVAKIGWAYDFNMVADDLIQKRAERTGDGSKF